jgi:hypothetical protein
VSLLYEITNQASLRARVGYNSLFGIGLPPGDSVKIFNNLFYVNKNTAPLFKTAPLKIQRFIVDNKILVVVSSSSKPKKRSFRCFDSMPTSLEF